jgi:acetyl-CoA synthetase
MSENELQEVSEAEIAVHWQEEEYFQPSTQFIAQANITNPDIYRRFSLDHFPECFKEYADLLSWDRYWHTTLDTSDAPCWKWFVGGRLNAAYNCVDRHLAKYKNKAAIVYVPEPEDEPHITLTYQELFARVNELSALLRDFAGLKAGDRVTLHMPMVPELPITMLACARLGVIHSEVYGGFSGAACGERIADSGSSVLITIDGYHRSGSALDHKEKSDIAIDVAKERGQAIDKVLGTGTSPAHPWSRAGTTSWTTFSPDTRARRSIPSPCRRRHRSFSCIPVGRRGSPKGASTASAATWRTSQVHRNTYRIYTRRMFTGAWRTSAG